MIMGVNHSWLLLIYVLLILSPTFNLVLVSCQCLEDQSSLLLQLKDGLEFNPEKSTKLVNWNMIVDCCIWNGVGCDTSGRVIILELDNEFISGGIENSTSLFKLQFLQKLNLAYNQFSYIQIPSGISNLKNLVYLNLSGGGFMGQIPLELSNLKKLVSLDLSSWVLKLENPNLKTLVQNLHNLEELRLDGVNISAQKNNWSQALASSLPRLRILSLIECGIEGPIDASLSELFSLSVIQLDRNNLSTTVPGFFANYSNLSTLSLNHCNLVGTFPAKFFQVSALKYLDLSNNELLHGSLEQFPHNGSLRTLLLSYTKFSGSLPSSISSIRNLSRIGLINCNFSGPIPPSIVNLSELVDLDFRNNSFTGPIPLFQNSKNLSSIYLSYNKLTESLSPAHFGGLLKLEYLYLESNSLTGSIPSSIFTLPLLRYLDLSHNKLSGQIHEFSNASTSLLQLLDLTANSFNESVPKSFFELRSLSYLSLSSNLFTGTIQFETIMNLDSLAILDLSFNNISVEPSNSNSTSLYLPLLESLFLASCNLKMFPDLSHALYLFQLDLSDNQIKGVVPNWFWKLGGGLLEHVNVSLNHLIGLQKPYNFPESLLVIDLHSNHLQGEIPIPPASVLYVDYSNNKFTNSIPPDIGNNLYSAQFLSLSNNSLTGSIPESVCHATKLQILDFSDNSLTGKIPSCVVENMNNLSVLNLEKNNLTDSIPDTFPVSCHLETLDLSSNALQGKIPRSLINCTYLRVLNIGINKLEDTFPCNLKNSSSLRVLILRSNKLYGDFVCHGANNFNPELQIIDIASNNFTGVLTPEYFSSWKRMILDDGDSSQIQGDYLRLKMVYGNGLYYQDKVMITVKGQIMKLVKILKIFTSIDLSINNFTGEIPDTIGDLRSLYILNLSHNAFMGRIPSSMGKLKSLGSLDMSVNQLSGEIPATLANLNFLAFLNLSFNKLSGRIPAGSQLQTFSEASYAGNTRLCEFPLNTTCIGDEMPSPSFPNTASQSKTEIKWEYVLAATGYTVGLASFSLVLLFCKSWSEKYSYYLDKLLFKIVKQKGGRSIAEKEFRNQAMRRR